MMTSRGESKSRRFPLEIWLEVFHELVASSEPLTKKELKAGTTWLSAIHVCRGWRDLIISSPRLWSYWRFQEAWDLSMLETFLERSKSVPLSIVFEKKSRWTPRNLRNLILILSKPEVSKRIGLLHIPCLNSELAEWYRSFTSPAPLMYSLHLEFDEMLGHPPTYTNFFGMCMPSLRDVHIDCLSAPWMPAAYKNLTRLRLSRQEAPSLDDVLEMLRSSPKLEELELQFISKLKTTVSSTSNRNSKIYLAHLKSLILGPHVEHRDRIGSEHDTFAILDHISFPDTTTLCIKFLDPLDPVRDLTQSYLPLTKRTSKAESVVLSLIPDYTGSSVRIRPAYEEGKTMSFSVRWSWCHGASQHNVLPPVLEYTGTSAIPLPEVRHLIIDCTFFQDVSETEWLSTLSGVPKLEHLRLHAGWTIVPLFGLFRVLERTLEPEAEGAKPVTLCPDLNRVSLYLLPGIEMLEDSWGNEIVTTLQARSASGHRVSNLSIMVPVDNAHEFPESLYNRLVLTVDECTIVPFDYASRPGF